MAIDFPASPSTNDTHTHNGLTWKYDGTSWILQTIIQSGGSFTGLTDTPATYTADKFIKVNSGGTVLEFTDAPSSTNLGFTVTNNGASSYSIDGTTGNPAITLVRGFEYTFNLSVTGHPFWIKTSAVTGTGNAYSTGVTNNGSQTGNLIFSVPLNAPNILYYICQYHSSMVGSIHIIDLGGGSSVDLKTTWNIPL